MRKVILAVFTLFLFLGSSNTQAQFLGIGYRSISQASVAPLICSAGGTACFTTLATAGLTSNWDADNIAACNGSVVTTWLDPVSSNNLTAAGSPTCSPNSFGSHNAVNFNGVDQLFNMSFNVAQTQTLYFVCTAANNNGYLFSGSGGSAPSGGLNAGKLAEDIEGSVNMITGSAGIHVPGSYEMAFSYDGTTASVYLNGTLDGTAPFSQPQFSGLDDTLFANNVGGSYTFYFSGSCSQALRYSTPYNPDVHAYLATKFGV
jgi:hypothetical protein